jgi:uncharacterized protein with beta-barrel porin domain
MQELEMLSGPRARAAYDAMSGELFPSLSTVGIENTDRFLRTVARRLRSRSLTRAIVVDQFAAWTPSDAVIRGQESRLASSRTAWGEGYGIGAAIAGNASGLDYSTGGLAFGNEFSFYLERGRNFHFGAVHVQPFAAVQSIQLYQNRFTESEADSLDLAVGGLRANSFRGLLGSRLVDHSKTKGGRSMSLEGRALWRHEFLNESRVLDATFAGQSGAFVINGVNVDRDAAILGTGLNLCLSPRARFYANYDTLTSQNYTAHGGNVGFTFLR